MGAWGDWSRTVAERLRELGRYQTNLGNEVSTLTDEVAGLRKTLEEQNKRIDALETIAAKTPVTVNVGKESKFRRVRRFG